MTTLVTRIGELEAHKAQLVKDKADVEARAAKLTGQRPDAAKISQVWRQVRAIWDVLSDEERADLMASLVEKVVITAKGEGILHLILGNQTVEAYDTSAVDKAAVTQTGCALKAKTTNPLSQVRHFDGLGCGCESYR